MTDYQMPVITEQEREERINRFSFEIKRLQSKRDCEQSEDRFFSGGDLWALQAFEIALAALTANPVVHEAEINGVMSSVTKSHFADCERYGVKTRKLYSAPTVPVKQQGEQ